MVIPGFLLYPAVVVATTALTSAYVWYKKPGLAVTLLIKLALLKAGCKVKRVQGCKFNYCYAEKGTCRPGLPSIVLVHGFSASKEMYLGLLNNLPKDIHVVALDLPGHGDTLPIPAGDLNMDVEYLTHSLHEFVQLIGLDAEPFHLIGASMGGLMSIIYSAIYSKNVKAVTLISPAVRCPTETSFIKEMRQGHSQLIPEDPAGIRNMMDITMYNKEKIPNNHQFLQGILEIRQPKNEYHKQLFESFRIALDSEKSEELEDFISHIHAPAQVLWGEHDELLHVSGAEMLQQKLPNCQRVDLMEKCGHSTIMDRPGLVTKHVLDFYRTQHNLPKKEA